MLTHSVRVLPALCSSQFESALFIALWLAFFKVFRVGKLVTRSLGPGQADFSGQALGMGDLRWEGATLGIRIQLSKTHQRELGQAVVIQFKLHSLACVGPFRTTYPCAHMTGPCYLSTLMTSPSPSFSTLPFFAEQQPPHPEHLTAHSFCTGAASAVGMPKRETRALGCWWSDAFHEEDYIHPYFKRHPQPRTRQRGCKQP